MAVSDGIQIAEGFRTAGSIFLTQGLLAAIAAGFYFQSWFAFLLVFGLCVATMFQPILAMLFAVVFIGFWGWLGNAIGGAGLCVTAVVISGFFNGAYALMVYADQKIKRRM